jgi:DNA-binding GntR family transcriptional regulator
MTNRPLSRIQQTALRDQVVEAIHHAVIRGDFKPGEKIPEQELAEQLGLSRTPIREAIRILEQQGLVETRPKSGTYIVRIDREQVRDGLLVRSALEELAVHQAVARLDRREWNDLCEKLQGLLHAIGEAVDRGDPIATTELDIEWHTLLVDAAQNRSLARAWRNAGLPFLVWPPERELYPLANEVWRMASFGRHQELLTALRGRDPNICREAVRSHILMKFGDLENSYPAVKGASDAQNQRRAGTGASPSVSRGR